MTLRRPSPKDLVYALLDAIAAERWSDAKRIARQVEITGPPSQRVVYAREWIERNRELHPLAAEWAEQKIREREAARDAATEPLMSRQNGQWPEKLYRRMGLW